MTKKTKLLLATLAIICLTAALCAVVPTASAADSYEYVIQEGKDFVVSDTPVLLVAKCDTSYQAIEANGTNVKSTKVEIEDDLKVTSKVNDTMLWIVGKSGNYFTFKNYSTNTYLNISGTNVVLQNYEGTFYSEKTLMATDNDRYISVTTDGVTSDRDSGTELQAYVRQEATSGGGGGAATVTRYKKSTLNIGDTKQGMLVAEYYGNNYAMTMYSATSTSPNKALYVTIDGEYLTSINTNTNSNSESSRKMSANIEDWMTWTIARTASGVTIQPNSTYSNSNTKYVNIAYSTYSLTNEINYFSYSQSDNGFMLKDVTGSYNIYIENTSNFGCNINNAAVLTFYEKVEEKLGPTAAVKFEKGKAPEGAGEITGDMPDVQAEIGKEYTLPDCTFTLEDYKFAGWLVNGENEPKQANEKVTVPEGGLTLTATWEYNVWEITYHCNDQKDVIDKVTRGDNYKVKAFETIFPSAQATDGQIFSHWDKENAPCGGNADKQYKAGTSYKIESDMTLVPHFVKAVKVTYDYDNGTDKVDTYEPENSQIHLKYSSSATHDEAHTFVSWWIDENGDGIVDDGEKYSSGAYYDLGEEDITVKALWSFEGFTITFKSQGKVIKVVEHAKVSSDTYFYFQAEGIEIPQAPEGQVFSKWTTSSKYNSNNPFSIRGDANDYSQHSLTLPNCNASGYYKVESYEVILEAQFVDAPIECTFKFVSESGEEISSVKKTISGTYTWTSLSLSATEHDHTGDIPEDMLPYWECDGEKYNSGDSIRINKTDESYEKTITVHYGKKITITWDFDEGSPNTSSTFYVEKVYAAGSKQYMSTSFKPTKDNYILLGFKCSLLGDTLCTPGTYFTVADEDMKFVAQWQYDGITLNFTNGEDIQTVEIAKGTKSYVIDVNDPTPEENHYFAGWKTDGDETLYKKNDTYNIGDDVTEVNFTAQFNECRDVKVTFHYDGQTKEKTYKELQENVLFNGALFNELFSDVFDSEKYTFEHWYKDESFGEQMPESFYTFEIGTEDFDLYAKVEKKVAITFEYGDGLGSTTLYGTKVAVPYTDLPTKENYELKGWSKNPDASTVDYEANPGVYVESDVDLTLYAVWEKTVWTLTFTDNGEITVEIFVNKTKEKFTIAEVLVGENSTKFQKEHKTITWKLDGTAKDVHDDITNDGDKTFVAEYTDTLYTIKFDGHGTDELQPKTAKFGDVVYLPQPKRDGYTFLHWVDNITEGKPTYTDKLTMGDKDITLTAGWTANEYKITFNTDGGSTVADIKAKTDDDISSLKPTDPTKTGYTFANWVLASDDSDDPEEYTFDKMPPHDVALKAIWTVNSYTLKVDKADGSQATEKQVAYGTNLEQELTAPTRDGYTFAGWYEDETEFEGTTMPDRDLTLTAHWTENSYTLTLDGNGGTLEQTTVTAKAGEEITLPTPTRNGYVFDGWYDGDSKFEATTMPNANKSLSAHWKIDSALFATKVQALKDATTLSDKRAAIKQVEELLALWAGEEDTPDATEYNTLKTQFDALSTTAAEDLSNAEKGANALVAIGTAVAALAAAACVAIIIKRRF